jgi:hypothetical protein
MINDPDDCLRRHDELTRNFLIILGCSFALLAKEVPFHAINGYLSGPGSRKSHFLVYYWKNDREKGAGIGGEAPFILTILRVN